MWFELWHWQAVALYYSIMSADGGMRIFKEALEVRAVSRYPVEDCCCGCCCCVGGSGRRHLGLIVLARVM